MDSDNALGSRSGDIDDGIALAVLMRSGVEIEAVASVFGNTTGTQALANHRALAEVCGWEGPCLAGANRADDPATPAAEHLVGVPGARILLALGPLTNVAQALRLRPRLAHEVDQLVCLGSNPASRGRWPPLWPFEFNFTKDRRALVQVFESALPICVVPLSQARRMRVRFSDLSPVQGELGAYLRLHARRWFRYARRAKLQSTVPVWDLVATTLVTHPELFRTDAVRARAHPSGWVEYGAGDRDVLLVQDFDPQEVWTRAVQTLNGCARPSAREAASTRTERASEGA